MSYFQNRLGYDNFIWWIGVVEDRADPLNLGRCRVRIFGSHTENKQIIKTENLPWAQPIVPVNGSMLSGTPQEGDYVFGFFMDGDSSQAPCILGVFPGIPQNFANPQDGFSDPRKQSELQNSPRKTKISGSSLSEDTPKSNPAILGEPTNSRLSRNVKIEETLIGYRNNTLDKNVPTSDGPSWSEPNSSYSAKFPYNRVLETESGHVLEFDDTPSSERINLSHRKGTFVEFHPNGSKVTKVVGDNFEIMLSDNNVHVKGSCNITVDGNANLYVKGDIAEKVDGNYTLNVSGDIVMNGKTINLNHGTKGAARIGDTADTGDDGTGNHFDLNSPGTNIIESGSDTVFIGD
jgi:hypothetical protein